MKKCPCHSGSFFDHCCGPYLTGKRTPLTPEALMRARYTAYATGNIAFIIETTHSKNPSFNSDREAWSKELLQHYRDTTFSGLEILDTTQNLDRGTVTFFAQLSRKGADASFGEHSQFIREDNQWFYLDGTII